MKKVIKQSNSQYLLRFLPIFFIFFLWFIFASPYLLHHKVPFPSTYQVSQLSPWSAYPIYHGPIKNGAMPDVIGQLYPWKYITISFWKQGTIPLWNPYSMSGTPLLANYQSAVLSPFNILFTLFQFIDEWSILILLQPLLAGLFMYLFARVKQVSLSGAALSAVSFMFCGFMTTWMGYGTLGYAILFLPLALYFVEKFYETTRYRYLACLSFTIPLSFLSGHFQISLYFLLFLICYILYLSFLFRTIKYSVVVFLFIGIGLLFCMPQLLPTIELYTQSLRSNLFITLDSIPWLYLPTFVAPDFFGNPVSRNDWFGHYAEWNGYIGAISLLIGLYALTRVKNKTVLFFSVMALISLLLAYSSPLQVLLISLHIPVISTSSLSRVIILFSFSFSVLSGFGLDFLTTDIIQERIRLLSLWCISISVLFIVLWAMVLTHLFLFNDKAAIAMSNLRLPTFFVFVLILLVLTSYFLKKRKIIVFVLCCILVLSGAEMLRFATKWQEFDPISFVYPTTGVSAYLSTHALNERVLGNWGGEATMYYGLSELEGYDPLSISRYGEFITSLDNGQLKEAKRSVVSVPRNGTYTAFALNLLNVRYIVQKISDGHAPWVFPFWTYPDGQFQKVYNDQSYEVYYNTKAYPRAYLVSNVIVQKDSQKILSSLFDHSFNAQNTIVLEKTPAILPRFGKGNITITSFLPNKISLSVSATEHQMLFLSNAYYPGWKASIDGRDTPVYRADYAFQAVSIPQGLHRIVFYYNPISFISGVVVALLGLVLLLCGKLFFIK